MISANRLINSIIYRTGEALQHDATFLAGLNNYTFSSGCFINGKFTLGYYPATTGGLSSALAGYQGQTDICPFITVLQPLKEYVSEDAVRAGYDLAFLTRSSASWGYETKMQQAFGLVLEPVYTTFFDQLKKSGYFRLPLGQQNAFPSHARYAVFTGGKEDTTFLNHYGDHACALEIHGLELVIKEYFTEKETVRIVNENDRLLQMFNN